MIEYYLLFKWGTLKGWRVPKEKHFFDLLEAAMAEAPLSAMCDKLTDDREAAILSLIDEMDKIGASFQNDWDGEEYTVEQAKKYITEYRK